MSEFHVEQLRVGGFDDNFSYVFFEKNSGSAAVVDPCGNISVIHGFIENNVNLSLKYILLTHGHHDHVSGVNEFRQKYNVPVVGHPECSVFTDIQPQNSQILPLGEGGIECLYAPGHTPDGMLYRLSDDSALFTGDTLFVDWCGYCDGKVMFNTMRNVIFPLADSNIVYSGHDYGREPCSLLGVEKKRNPYLAAKNFSVFEKALENL